LVALGLAVAREQFALRRDDQVACGRMVATGAGFGFVARHHIRLWPGAVPVLPALKIPPLPCWLAVHREIRGSALVRRKLDLLAGAITVELARAVEPGP
jgi:DNA-binding transcriptional LysR family regulator